MSEFGYDEEPVEGEFVSLTSLGSLVKNNAVQVVQIDYNREEQCPILVLKYKKKTDRKKTYLFTSFSTDHPIKSSDENSVYVQKMDQATYENMARAVRRKDSYL